MTMKIKKRNGFILHIYFFISLNIIFRMQIKLEIWTPLSQTLHTIEKVIVPVRLPFVSRSGAKKKLDIALIKLGKGSEYDLDV